MTNVKILISLLILLILIFTSCYYNVFKQAATTKNCNNGEYTIFSNFFYLKLGI